MLDRNIFISLSMQLYICGKEAWGFMAGKEMTGVSDLLLEVF